jgi:hypothetical protein
LRVRIIKSNVAIRKAFVNRKTLHFRGLQKHPQEKEKGFWATLLF